VAAPSGGAPRAATAPPAASARVPAAASGASAAGAPLGAGVGAHATGAPRAAAGASAAPAAQGAPPCEPSAVAAGRACLNRLVTQAQRLFVDANMKMFIRQLKTLKVHIAAGHGDGLYAGPGQVVAPPSQIAAILAWWDTQLSRAPAPQGADCRQCQSGDAAYVASSEAGKRTPNVVTGHACVTCEHGVFELAMALLRGEAHVFHLIALLYVALSGAGDAGDAFLFSDISCEQRVGAPRAARHRGGPLRAHGDTLGVSPSANPLPPPPPRHGHPHVYAHGR
jgi:hypothetical protein